jgi:hypothetical protein
LSRIIRNQVSSKKSMKNYDIFEFERTINQKTYMKNFKPRLAVNI